MMRHILLRALILGIVALPLLVATPKPALAEFGQVQMGVNGMI